MTRSSGNLVSSLLQIFRILPPLLPPQRWVLIIILIIVYYNTGNNRSDVQLFQEKLLEQVRLLLCMLDVCSTLSYGNLSRVLPFFCGFVRAVMVFSACLQLQLEKLYYCFQNGYSFVEFVTFRLHIFPLLTKGISFKVKAVFYIS